MLVDDNYTTVDELFGKMREGMVAREVNKAVEAVKIHSINEHSEIGERELRKILN